MAANSTNFFDARAAARRRLVYIVCALVIGVCAVAFVVISGSGSGGPAPETRSAASAKEKPDQPRPRVPPTAEEAVTNGGARKHVPVAPSPEEAPPELREANELFHRGVGRMREALRADRGSKEAGEARRGALEAFLEARSLYDAYLDIHTDPGPSLLRRYKELIQHVSNCRKDMVLTDLPGGEESAAVPPPVVREPSRPGPGAAAPPRATPPESAFRPDQAAARFRGAARRALAEGRPDRILEVGRPLLEDPRMEGHRDKIPEMVELAAQMEDMLEAARKGLAAQCGKVVHLTLREGEEEGTLLSMSDGITLRTVQGEKKLRISDLAPKQLLTFAQLGAGLGDAGARRAAGAYLLLRGDREAGARELLVARSLGADITRFEERLAQVVPRSPELKALAAYLALVPRLSAGDAEVIDEVEEFKAEHRKSEVFAERREEIFRACAEAAVRNPFRLEDLYSVEGKVGKGGVQLVYPFEDAAELRDFGASGKWRIETGALRCEKGSIWLERFVLKNVDFRFVTEEPVDLVAGLWPSRQWARGSVNLKVSVGPAGLTLSLRHRDRSFAREVVPLLRGQVEILIQKREDKYQVRVNRKIVLKETDKEHRRGEDPVVVGFATDGAPLAISEMEVRTALDLEWARAGGNRFSTWIGHWHVAGPFDLPGRDLKEGLALKWWPETEAFDPDASGEDGKPRWRYRRCTGNLDLRPLLRPQRPAAGYIVARVWSPDRRSAILELSVDDDARAWLNGSLVLPTAPLGKTHRAAVKLEPGDNLLLVKVVDVGGGYWAKARFLTKAGEPMRDLQSW